MSKIKVNITEFEKIAAKFQTAADNTVKINSRIQNATENLSGNWQGKSKNAFKKEYDTLVKNMSSYKVILEGISKDIKEVALRFEETDDSLKTNFNSDT